MIAPGLAALDFGFTMRALSDKIAVSIFGIPEPTEGCLIQRGAHDSERSVAGVRPRAVDIWRELIAIELVEVKQVVRE